MIPSGYSYSRSQIVERCAWLMTIFAVSSWLLAEACASPEPPSDFEHDVKEAEAYDFALCLPVNYAQKSATFSAQVEANNNGSLAYSRRVVFTATEVAGAWSVHCALIKDANPNASYLVGFKEQLTGSPDLALIHHPAVLTHPYLGWGGLKMQVDGKSADSMPYATMIPPIDDGYYRFTAIAADGNGPVVVMRAMQPGEDLLPR